MELLAASTVPGEGPEGRGQGGKTMRRTIRGALGGIFALTAAALALPAAPAQACINGVLEEEDEKIEAVGRAERHLAAGRAGRAFRLAAGARAMGSGGAPNAWVDMRIEQVMAVATARLGGQVDLDRGSVRRGLSAERRRENLHWALAAMDRAVARDQSPLTRARRAEVLARIPARRAEALRALEELAAADLVPDAWGWAALARLRGHEGDAAGRAEALDRCKTTAGPNARAICGEARRTRARSRDS